MTAYEKDICRGIPNLKDYGVAYYMYGLDKNELALLDKPEPIQTLNDLTLLPNSDLSVVRNIKEYAPKTIVSPVVQKITPPPVVIKQVSKNDEDDSLDKIMYLIVVCLVITVFLKKSGRFKQLMNKSDPTIRSLTVEGGGCTGGDLPIGMKSSYMGQMPPTSYLGPDGTSPSTYT